MMEDGMKDGMEIEGWTVRRVLSDSDEGGITPTKTVLKTEQIDETEADNIIKQEPGDAQNEMPKLPYLRKAKLDMFITSLDRKHLTAIAPNLLTNGLVLELKSLRDLHSLSQKRFNSWIKILRGKNQSASLANQDQEKASLFKMQSESVQKLKDEELNSVEAFLNAPFILSSCASTHSGPSSFVPCVSSISCAPTSSGPSSFVPCVSSISCAPTSSGPSSFVPCVSSISCAPTSSGPSIVPCVSAMPSIQTGSAPSTAHSEEETIDLTSPQSSDGIIVKKPSKPVWIVVNEAGPKASVTCVRNREILSSERAKSDKRQTNSGKQVSNSLCFLSSEFKYMKRANLEKFRNTLDCKHLNVLPRYLLTNGLVLELETIRTTWRELNIWLCRLQGIPKLILSDTKVLKSVQRLSSRFKILAMKPGRAGEHKLLEFLDEPFRMKPILKHLHSAKQSLSGSSVPTSKPLSLSYEQVQPELSQRTSSSSDIRHCNTNTPSASVASTSDLASGTEKSLAPLSGSEFAPYLSATLDRSVMKDGDNPTHDPPGVNTKCAPPSSSSTPIRLVFGMLNSSGKTTLIQSSSKRSIMTSNIFESDKSISHSRCRTLFQSGDKMVDTSKGGTLVISDVASTAQVVPTSHVSQTASNVRKKTSKDGTLVTSDVSSHGEKSTQVFVPTSVDKLRHPSKDGTLVINNDSSTASYCMSSQACQVSHDIADVRQNTCKDGTLVTSDVSPPADAVPCPQMCPTSSVRQEPRKRKASTDRIAQDMNWMAAMTQDNATTESAKALTKSSKNYKVVWEPSHRQVVNISEKIGERKRPIVDLDIDIESDATHDSFVTSEAKKRRVESNNDREGEGNVSKKNSTRLDDDDDDCNDEDDDGSAIEVMEEGLRNTNCESETTLSWKQPQESEITMEDNAEMKDSEKSTEEDKPSRMDVHRLIAECGRNNDTIAVAVEENFPHARRAGLDQFLRTKNDLDLRVLPYELLTNGLVMELDMISTTWTQLINWIHKLRGPELPSWTPDQIKSHVAFLQKLVKLKYVSNPKIRSVTTLNQLLDSPFHAWSEKQHSDKSVTTSYYVAHIASSKSPSSSSTDSVPSVSSSKAPSLSSKAPSLSSTSSSWSIPSSKAFDSSSKAFDPSSKAFHPSSKAFDPTFDASLIKTVDPPSKTVDPSPEPVDRSQKTVDPSSKTVDPASKIVDPAVTNNVPSISSSKTSTPLVSLQKSFPANVLPQSSVVQYVQKSGSHQTLKQPVQTLSNQPVQHLPFQPDKDLLPNQVKTSTNETVQMLPNQQFKILTNQQVQNLPKKTVKELLAKLRFETVKDLPLNKTVKNLANQPVQNIQKQPVQIIQKQPVQIIQKQPVQIIQKQPVQIIQKQPVQNIQQPILTVRPPETIKVIGTDKLVEGTQLKLVQVSSSINNDTTSQESAQNPRYQLQLVNASAAPRQSTVPTIVNTMVPHQVSNMTGSIPGTIRSTVGSSMTTTSPVAASTTTILNMMTPRQVVPSSNMTGSAPGPIRSTFGSRVIHTSPVAASTTTIVNMMPHQVVAGSLPGTIRSTFGSRVINTSPVASTTTTIVNMMTPRQLVPSSNLTGAVPGTVTSMVGSRKMSSSPATVFLKASTASSMQMNIVRSNPTGRPRVSSFPVSSASYSATSSTNSPLVSIVRSMYSSSKVSSASSSSSSSLTSSGSLSLSGQVGNEAREHEQDTDDKKNETNKTEVCVSRSPDRENELRGLVDQRITVPSIDERMKVEEKKVNSASKQIETLVTTEKKTKKKSKPMEFPYMQIAGLQEFIREQTIENLRPIPRHLLTFGLVAELERFRPSWSVLNQWLCVLQGEEEPVWSAQKVNYVVSMIKDQRNTLLKRTYPDQRRVLKEYLDESFCMTVGDTMKLKVKKTRRLVKTKSPWSVMQKRRRAEQSKEEQGQQPSEQTIRSMQEFPYMQKAELKKFFQEPIIENLRQIPRHLLTYGLVVELDKLRSTLRVLNQWLCVLQGEAEPVWTQHRLNYVLSLIKDQRSSILKQPGEKKLLEEFLDNLFWMEPKQKKPFRHWMFMFGRRKKKRRPWTKTKRSNSSGSVVPKQHELPYMQRAELTEFISHPVIEKLRPIPRHHLTNGLISELCKFRTTWHDMHRWLCILQDVTYPVMHDTLCVRRILAVVNQINAIRRENPESQELKHVLDTEFMLPVQARAMTQGPPSETVTTGHTDGAEKNTETSRQTDGTETEMETAETSRQTDEEEIDTESSETSEQTEGAEMETSMTETIASVTETTKEANQIDEVPMKQPQTKTMINNSKTFPYLRKTGIDVDVFTTSLDNKHLFVIPECFMTNGLVLELDSLRCRDKPECKEPLVWPDTWKVMNQWLCILQGVEGTSVWSEPKVAKEVNILKDKLKSFRTCHERIRFLETPFKMKPVVRGEQVILKVTDAHASVLCSSSTPGNAKTLTSTPGTSAAATVSAPSSNAKILMSSTFGKSASMSGCTKDNVKIWKPFPSGTHVPMPGCSQSNVKLLLLPPTGTLASTTSTSITKSGISVSSPTECSNSPLSSTSIPPSIPSLKSVFSTSTSDPKISSSSLISNPYKYVKTVHITLKNSENSDSNCPKIPLQLVPMSKGDKPASGFASTFKNQTKPEQSLKNNTDGSSNTPKVPILLMVPPEEQAVIPPGYTSLLKNQKITLAQSFNKIPERTAKNPNISMTKPAQSLKKRSKITSNMPITKPAQSHRNNLEGTANIPNMNMTKLSQSVKNMPKGIVTKSPAIVLSDRRLTGVDEKFLPGTDKEFTAEIRAESALLVSSVKKLKLKHDILMSSQMKDAVDADTMKECTSRDVGSSKDADTSSCIGTVRDVGTSIVSGTSLVVGTSRDADTSSCVGTPADFENSQSDDSIDFEDTMDSTFNMHSYCQPPQIENRKTNSTKPYISPGKFKIISKYRAGFSLKMDSTGKVRRCFNKIQNIELSNREISPDTQSSLNKVTESMKQSHGEVRPVTQSSLNKVTESMKQSHGEVRPVTQSSLNKVTESMKQSHGEVRPVTQSSLNLTDNNSADTQPPLKDKKAFVGQRDRPVNENRSELKSKEVCQMLVSDMEKITESQTKIMHEYSALIRSNGRLKTKLKKYEKRIQNLKVNFRKRETDLRIAYQKPKPRCKDSAVQVKFKHKCDVCPKLREDVDNLLKELESAPKGKLKKVRTKNGKRYTEALTKCVEELVTHQVAGTQVGNVIKSVLAMVGMEPTSIPSHNRVSEIAQRVKRDQESCVEQAIESFVSTLTDQPEEDLMEFNVEQAIESSVSTLTDAPE